MTELEIPFVSLWAKSALTDPDYVKAQAARNERLLRARERVAFGREFDNNAITPAAITKRDGAP
ncbi:MAG: hypothetical protein JWM91_2491 [Rhodospirillales bacterium]|nr:hypothetical protein [Rhodospirillales bacterium]